MSETDATEHKIIDTAELPKDPNIVQMYRIIDVLDHINASMISMFDTVNVLFETKSSVSKKQMYVNNLRNALEKQRRKLQECIKEQQKIDPIIYPK
jgi:hypothetical protein